MSLEIKVGDSFVPFEFAPMSVKLDLEWALMNKAEVVVKQTTPTPVGICKVCEYAHEGLYCTNCFTGERVRVGARKFAKVIRLHEIKKEVK
jgi:hypothetical protein